MGRVLGGGCGSRLGVKLRRSWSLRGAVDRSRPAAFGEAGAGWEKEVVAPAASLRPSAEGSPPIRVTPRMDGASGYFLVEVVAQGGFGRPTMSILRS